MKYSEFLTWLLENKNMSIRSARDVISRLKRVLLIIHCDELDDTSIHLLNTKSDFLDLSISVKSQLRRAASLYIEFQK